MIIFNQLGIILGIWAVGELISSLISNIITMPGTIIGMIILFLLLQFKIMKEETIKDVADFLLGNMARINNRKHASFIIKWNYCNSCNNDCNRKNCGSYD